MGTKKRDLQDIVLKEINNYLKQSDLDISLGTDLEALGIDSLGAITILYELEDRLSLEIPNEVIETLKSVEDIVEYLFVELSSQSEK